jgi:flavin reductase (DIM6/NTAB) family NADH-FMN oxidoreductase RutF
MRKLWNRPALPVWSLSTIDEKGAANMNICVYVTSISMQPKMMLIAVYHHTKTLDNLKKRPHGILQLLTTDHLDIVHTCGRQSGNSVNKISKVTKKHPVAQKQQFSYMTDVAGYMELTITELRDVGGDHMLAVAEVVSSKNISDNDILTTTYLKEKGVIR